MKRATRGILIFAITLLGACSGNSVANGAQGRSRANLITYEEIRQHGEYSSLYDLIAQLRPRWLRSQGPDTLLGEQGQVQVHMDGNRLGGVDVLQGLSPSGVTSITFLAPIDASARYGLDHSHGAIIISTSAESP
jgi:hypothetical protein